MLVCDAFDDLGRDDPACTVRLGIFGGTFDPIHTGHLAAAERVREEAQLDAIVILPAGVPVFKLDQQVTSAQARLDMCRLAVAGNPCFDVSPLEVRREGNTYTYDTLLELRAHYPANVELFFIAGADAIITLGKWRNAVEMTKLAHFIAMTRPGYSRDEAERAVYVDGKRLDVAFIEVPGLDISSSTVRERVRAGRSIRYLVPESVREYIEARGLYR